MLLICEKTEDVRFITEADATDPVKQRMYIEGVYLQAGIKNRNGRIYPVETMDRECNRYISEVVAHGRAVGELGHPNGPTINLERVSHRIVSLKKEGNNYIGKAMLTDTPYGKTAQGLISDGVNLGVSSRAMGSLTERNGVMEVQSDFRLATAADIVQDPSAPDAFVRGIMEGVQWWYDVASGSWVKESLDDTRRHIKTLSISQISEQKVGIFETFMGSLLKKQ
jgi:hypothetical protein